MTQMSSESVL